MTSIDAGPQLSAPSQALIDLRLDTLDRMLLGRMPRHDRVTIVSEVEAQIFELLSQRGDEPSRDDVLAVLGQLDPPEAYLPDHDLLAESGAPRARIGRPAASVAGSAAEFRWSRPAAILGLCGLGLAFLSPVLYVVALFLDSIELLLMGLIPVAIAMFVCGLLGVIFSSISGFRCTSSVLGFVTGAIAVLLSFASVLLVLCA